MDGREAISSFYLRRGFGSPPGMHPPPAFIPLSNPNPNPNLNPNQSPRPAVRSPGFGSLGSAFHVEPSSSHGGGLVGEGIEGGEAKEPVIKRKRGRPRKYGPDGAMALALSPTNSTPGSEPGPESDASQKRGRGRPPGSGRKQQLASLGEWYSGSAGTGFTPHVITIPIGEDIAAKIMSFSQQGPRAVCILSANGSVSTVTLRQPATSGGTVTYEGRFEILCLSGSYLLSDEGGSRTRSGGLSISLSSPDGRVIGGGVGGLLLAASPVQVIVGSFMYGGAKSKSKPKTCPESGVEPEASTLDKQGTSSSTSPGQNLSTSVTGRWPVSRQVEIQNQSSGIDLTQG